MPLTPVWWGYELRGNGSVCLKSEFWAVLAPSMLCLLNMQWTAGGFDLLLLWRKDPLWKAPCWVAQATLLGLWRGTNTIVILSKTQLQVFILLASISLFQCICFFFPHHRSSLLMNAQRQRAVTGIWSTSPVLNVRSFLEGSVTSWRTVDPTVVAALNRCMQNIVRPVENTLVGHLFNINSQIYKNQHTLPCLCSYFLLSRSWPCSDDLRWAPLARHWELFQLWPMQEFSHRLSFPATPGSHLLLQGLRSWGRRPRLRFFRLRLPVSAFTWIPL